MSDSLQSAYNYLEHGDYRRAAQVIDRLAARMAGDRQLEMLKARYAHMTQDHNACIAILEALPDDDAQTNILLGDAYFAKYKQAPVGHSRRDDAEEALRRYHRVINDPGDYNDLAWVYYRIGQVFKALDQRESATHYFRHALNMPAITPAVKSYAYEQLAQYELYDLRDFKQALSLIDLAIAVYEVDAGRDWLVRAHLFRARILQMLKRHQQVVQAVNTALQQAKICFESDMNALSDAYFNAGEILDRSEGYEAHSAAHMRQYLKLRPQPEGIDISWARANEVIAHTEFAEGRYQTALQAYEAILQYNPYHPWQTSIYYYIARCHYHQGHYHAAIATINQLLDNAQDDKIEITDFRIYDMLGSAQFASGDYRSAAISYQTALAMAPEQPEIIDKITLYWHYSLQLAKDQEES
ncbi:MAG: hypothetical protein EA396_06400 [Anaerolineaceae bacterium]|nr:MAG: hypothetical protein EA396_06400 [Anaerolineaceae bacterium]